MTGVQTCALPIYTNIHHAIDAILIGLTNQSWLQELSNTFRENMGVIDDVARQNIKKVIPLIEGIEPKELIEMIENNYNAYGEDSIFYKDIFGKTKAVNCKNRAEPDTDVGVRPDAKTEFNRTVKRS